MILDSLISHFEVLVTHLIAIGIGGALAQIYFWFRKYYLHKRQLSIFSGFKKKTLFIYPQRDPCRDDKPGAILPLISTEDFLAINNIISAYLKINWDPPGTASLKDSVHVTDQDLKSHNLILICSPKTNKKTQEALDLLRKHNAIYKRHLPTFHINSQTDHWEMNHNGDIITSKSFEQNNPSLEYPLEDSAIIVKSFNPWNPKYRLLILAGIRGIGTWGAAEMLKKWTKKIYEKKGNSLKKGTSKEGNFIAYIKVMYTDLDIKEPPADSVQVIDLDERL